MRLLQVMNDTIKWYYRRNGQISKKKKKKILESPKT